MNIPHADKGVGMLLFYGTALDVVRLRLSVGKAIVEKMGGRISLTSVAGQGTSVKVILPVLLQ